MMFYTTTTLYFLVCMSWDFLFEYFSYFVILKFVVKVQGAELIIAAEEL